MGRIQRKKPVGKKKQKENGDNGDNGGEEVGAARENAGMLENTIPFAAGIGETRKKPAGQGKKTLSFAKGDKKREENVLDKAIQFLREVRTELKRVVWPTRAQTMGSTAVVLVLTMIMSFFLGLIDFSLSNLVRVVLG